MEQLPSDSREELILQLEDSLVNIEIYNPVTAVDKMKAMTHYYRAGCSLYGGFMAYLVGKHDKAESLFTRVVPHSRMAVAENKHKYEDNKLQCALFSYAMLLGDERQIDESANLLISVGVSKESRFIAPSIFYVIVAHLWRGEMEAADALLNELEKLENKKNEFYVHSGLSSLIRGIATKNTELINEGGNLLIKKHIHTAKYFRTALKLDHYYNDPLTILTVVGRKHDVDVKSYIGNTKIVVKTKTFSPIDRPEVPKNKKFEVPIDLIPDCFLQTRNEYPQ